MNEIIGFIKKSLWRGDKVLIAKEVGISRTAFDLILAKGDISELTDYQREKLGDIVEWVKKKNQEREKYVNSLKP